MTIEDYIKGCTNYPVPDLVISNILARMNINAGTQTSNLTQRQIDLCEANLFARMLGFTSIGGSTSDSDGGWKHTESGWSLSPSDKKYLLHRANEIFSRYGEETIESVSEINVIVI